MQRMARHGILLTMLVVIVGGVSAQTSVPDALQLYRSGRYEEAIATTLREIDISPGNMDSYTVLGWSLLSLDRYNEALEYSNNALQIAPFDSRLVEIAAEANFFLGRYIEALPLFERYAVLAPNGSLLNQAYYYMGEIFVQFGEFHHADIVMSTAVYLEESRPQWWARLGFVREQIGDQGRALNAYNRALQLDPQFGAALQGRTRVSGGGTSG